MQDSYVNKLNQHDSSNFSSNEAPCGPHVGGWNKISSNIMKGGKKIETDIPDFALEIGGGGIADADDELTKFIQDGGGALSEGKMQEVINQMGGKVRPGESIAHAFFALLKKRKTLGYKRGRALNRSFKSLLRTRRKLYHERRDKLRNKFKTTYERSPRGQMMGRDMSRSNNRIVLKQNIGKSIAQSIGKASHMTGGVKHCSKSCRVRSHRHGKTHHKRVRFHPQTGGAGYGVGGVNLPSDLSSLAPGLITRYECDSGPYQHYK